MQFMSSMISPLFLFSTKLFTEKGQQRPPPPGSVALYCKSLQVSWYFQSCWLVQSFKNLSQIQLKTFLLESDVSEKHDIFCGALLKHHSTAEKHFGEKHCQRHNGPEG